MGVADYADEEADRVKDGDADHAGGTESHYTYHRCQEIRASPAYARAEPPIQQTQFFPKNRIPNGNSMHNTPVTNTAGMNPVLDRKRRTSCWGRSVVIRTVIQGNNSDRALKGAMPLPESSQPRALAKASITASNT